MDLTYPFRTACVQVCARLWSELEEQFTILALPLNGVEVGDAKQEPLYRWRQTLLLELTLLKDRCATLRERQCLTGAEEERVVDLVARVSQVLAFEAAASLPQVALRIARAQNLLFDEVKALAIPSSEEQRRAG